MLPASISSILTTFALITNAYAILFLVIEVRRLGRTYVSEAKAARMERTLRAIQLPSRISETIEFSLKEKENHLKPMGIRWKSDIDNISEATTEALEYLETLATGILSGLYDEDMAYSRIGNRVVFFYEKNKRFIYESQSLAGSDLYVQLTQLARNWQSRERHAGYKKPRV
jgi:hypothetical protein